MKRQKEVPERYEEKETDKKEGNVRTQWLIMPNAAESFSQKWLCNVALVTMAKGAVSINAA